MLDESINNEWFTNNAQSPYKYLFPLNHNIRDPCSGMSNLKREISDFVRFRTPDVAIPFSFNKF